MPEIRTRAELAGVIDHSVLKAVATPAQVRAACAEARERGFRSVCVNPSMVPLCAGELAGSAVAVCAVVGYPLGANRSAVKAEEARLAVADGAAEVDMVVNIGLAKAHDWAGVEADIAAVVRAAAPAAVKAVIETCFLTDEEKARVCQAAAAAGAAYVMTSTGFGTGGATVEDIRLMRRAVGDAVKVKASGGIRSLADARAMLDAGAERIGASGGLAILAELPE